MGLVELEGHGDEVPDSTVLPGRQEFVHGPVEGLPAQRRRPRPGRIGREVHAEGQGRGPQHPCLFGYVGHEALYNEGAGSEGKMGTELLQCRHRKEESRIRPEVLLDLLPGEFVQGT